MEGWTHVHIHTHIDTGVIRYVQKMGSFLPNKIFLAYKIPVKACVCSQSHQEQKQRLTSSDHNIQLKEYFSDL